MIRLNRDRTPEVLLEHYGGYPIYRLAKHLYLVYIPDDSESANWNRVHLLDEQDRDYVATFFIAFASHQLESLYIDEKYRNQGAATSIIQWAIQNIGLKDLYVVSDNWRAIQLYQKLGFKTTHSIDNGMSETKLIRMSLS